MWKRGARVCVYSAVSACLFAFTHTVCLGGDPLTAPGAERLTPQNTPKGVCVPQFWRVCSADQMIAGVSEFVNAIRVMDRSSDCSATVGVRSHYS